MTTSGPPVALERHGPGVVHLTLDRPSRGNLLDAAVLDALEEHLAGLAADQEVAVAVLRGRGPDFCLGRDRGVGGPPPPAKVFAGLDQVQRVNQALGAFPGISVAGVRGRALGAGASLAARCDLVVAADTARLAFPEVHDAIAPMIVMSHFGKVLPEKPFLDLVLTGREVSADEAQRIGLVSRVVP
ncbi:MAG: enoyl-CoA hydratase/isomerase family protein [Acidimicrobiales bacterium]